jgi:hypothetical protein
LSFLPHYQEAAIDKSQEKTTHVRIACLIVSFIGSIVFNGSKRLTPNQAAQGFSKNKSTLPPHLCLLSMHAIVITA